MIKINETLPQYRIDKLVPGSDDAMKLFAKHLLDFQDKAKFWKLSLDVGMKCMQMRRRDIFTSGQRKKYIDDDKIPVEPQEMKVVINALGDLIRKGVRTSVVTYDDNTPSDTAASPEVINSVIKQLEVETRLQRLKEEALDNALITGFPSWILFDQEYDITGDHKQLYAFIPKWNSVLPYQWFKNKDGSDIIDIVIIYFLSDEELEDAYPDRYEVYKKHNKQNGYDKENFSRVLGEDTENTVSDRSNIIMNAINSADFDTKNGQHMILEHLYQVRKKRELQIREDPYDVVEMLSVWDEQRKEKWKLTHQDYDLKHVENAKCLWVTTIGSNGFVWENGEHWFQEDGALPGKCLIADMVDGIPTAIGPDMMPRILSKAASDTEGLNQVRVGSKTTTHLVGGTLLDPGSVKPEMNSQNGVVRHDMDAVKKLGGVKNSVMEVKSTPNTTFFEFSNKTREDMNYENGINDAMRAITHPRQSDKAKQSDLTQGLSTQSNYVMAYNYFELDIKNLLLKLLPYRYTEEEIIQINDDYGKPKDNMKINEGGFNYFGEAEIIANDLTICRYKAIPILKDDSPTNKEREKQELMDFLASAGNTLLQYPKFFSSILMSLENRFAKELGSQIAEQAEQMEQAQQAQAQAEKQQEKEIEDGRRAVDYAKMDKTKKSFNINIKPEDAQQNTAGTQALAEYFNK